MLSQQERLDTVTASAAEMIRPSVFGQVIIILVYTPLLAFTGVEGKTFEPMALAVMIALTVAFVLSLTFVPAAVAVAIRGRVTEEENLLVRTLKRWYAPILRTSIARPLPVVAAAALLFVGAALLFTRLGQEFTPTLDEKNIVMEVKRVPSTALAQSQRMQLLIEKQISTLDEVSFVFSRTGTPDLAADPMPPSSSDTYIIVKPQEQWPDPSATKEDLIKKIEAVTAKLPGNKVGFSQPIEMRFNELIAGVREDLAVKVFGDDFRQMQKTAGQIADVIRKIDGAESVKTEETSGLPFLEIKIDKGEIARRGLSLAAVQYLIATAIGGTDAGLVFEGDRRFKIVVRLSDALRDDIPALEELPVPLPHGNPNTPAATIPLRSIASFEQTTGYNQISRENGKRRVVATAEIRGRDIGSLVADAQAKVSEQVKLPSGSYLAWGGQFENFAVARQRLAFVVPGVFALIFMLLFGALGSVRDAALVFSAAGADGRDCGALAPWHAVLDLCRGRFHRTVRSRGPERPGHADPDSLVDRRGRRSPPRHRRGRVDTLSPRRDDRAGRLARFRAYGPDDRDRRRGPETAGHGGHRWAAHCDASDARRAAGALRQVRDPR